MYTQHCSACHGQTGGGNGTAALFLFPKPRDLRAGRFRLVSTANGVPTLEDIEAVLNRGMPGSSMPPWKHLGPEKLRLLAEQVKKFHLEGSRESQLAVAAEADEELSEEELADRVKGRTTPGEPIAVPEIPAATSEAIARGKELYVKQGCVSCHGTEGRGDGQQQMVDSEGLPTRPRDLLRGIYKGSPDPASVYRRILAGMPGSPMPASQQVTPEQVVDMTHFILSLSDEKTRAATVLSREKIVARRVPRLPEGPDSEIWKEEGAARVGLTPLWWRDDAESLANVEAVHDGNAVAVMVSWSDATHNDNAALVDLFEDMAAIELYQGSAEPFLGMGDAGTALDVWQWRAGKLDAAAADSQLDDYPFDTDVYRDLLKGQEMPDFVAARAAGNPLAGGQVQEASLTAKGFGSLTFRPRASQLVKAGGEWKDGRWRVVFTRPLEVKGDDGFALSSGSGCSLAVAIWNGEARDRGGQKMISIWHYLRLL